MKLKLSAKQVILSITLVISGFLSTPAHAQFATASACQEVNANNDGREPFGEMFKCTTEGRTYHRMELYSDKKLTKNIGQIRWEVKKGSLEIKVSRPMKIWIGFPNGSQKRYNIDDKLNIMGGQTLYVTKLI